MTTIIIRPVRLRDVSALHRVFVHAVRTNFTYFPEHYQRQVIAEHRPHKLMLAAIHPRRIILAAYEDRSIVGYAIGNVPNTKIGQLYWLYVSPENRGHNTGLTLLSRMLKLQRKLGAQAVTLATHDHRRYYERQGFRYVEQKVIEGVKVDVMRFEVGRS